MTAGSDHSRANDITLYSSNRSLQTGVLAALIAEKMELSCNVIHEMPTNGIATQLVLIDCQGHGVSELRALVGEINEQEQHVDVVLLNTEPDSEHEELLDWPCIAGLFFSDTDQDQLLRGLECLLRGEFWVPRRLLHKFLEKNRRAPSFKRTDTKLTKRERQILKLIKDGATNLDISESLAVSEHTVKSHLYNVYKKIGVRNRLEASNWVRDFEEL